MVISYALRTKSRAGIRSHFIFATEELTMSNTRPSLDTIAAPAVRLTPAATAFCLDTDRRRAIRGAAPALPCPFCGDPHMVDVFKHEHGDGSATYSAACGECGAEGPSRESPLSAARAWNSRSMKGGAA